MPVNSQRDIKQFQIFSEKHLKQLNKQANIINIKEIK